MPGQFSGALTRRYAGYVDVSALPGIVTQQRHDADTDDSSPDDNRDRAQAPAGGGSTPYEWLDGQVPVGAGSPQSDNPDWANHTASGQHAGADGRGRGRWVGQDGERVARPTGPQHTPATLVNAGSSGAAFGGQVKTGSMDPVANPGGVDLGHTYNSPADSHRQGLHFNRPGLRIIRAPGRTSAEYTSVSAGAGPSAPRLRRQVRPAGQTDFLPVDQAPALYAGERENGSIGGGWAL